MAVRRGPCAADDGVETTVDATNAAEPVPAIHFAAVSPQYSFIVESPGTKLEGRR
jgi:hypothetical protein